jgi:hypothetical protein
VADEPVHFKQVLTGVLIVLKQPLESQQSPDLHCSQALTLQFLSKLSIQVSPSLSKPSEQVPPQVPVALIQLLVSVPAQVPAAPVQPEATEMLQEVEAAVQPKAELVLVVTLAQPSGAPYPQLTAQVAAIQALEPFQT